MADDVKRIAPNARPLDKDFGVASYKRNEWRLNLSDEFSFESLQNSSFLANQVDKVRGHNKQGGRGDIVEVFKESTEEYGRFIITAIGDGYIKMRQIEGVKAPEVSQAEDSPLTTRWNPGKRGHEVIRAEDKIVMAGPFQTKDVAVAWINDHLKKMAA